MKASELRIGNWVYTIEGNKQIIELRRSENYPKGINHNVTDDVRVSGLFLGPIGGVLPIPLTEEWLLKFDFYNKCNLGMQGAIDESDGTFFLWSGMGNFRDYGLEVKIQYVHQLQNLYFALTGEELELK